MISQVNGLEELIVTISILFKEETWIQWNLYKISMIFLRNRKTILKFLEPKDPKSGKPSWERKTKLEASGFLILNHIAKL
jgi:hypothetical protein